MNTARTSAFQQVNSEIMSELSIRHLWHCKLNLLSDFSKAKFLVAKVSHFSCQLEEHIVRLREELDREREERNYFQLERDKVNTFWEITKRQYEEKKAELRNKEREMEEAEERHQVEIKVYKQKVKHLLYEHQNNITELKAESK